MLQPRKGRTAVNAHPRTPSQTLPTAAEEVLCHHSESFYSCPGGEIGRRTGLKIPGPERDVPVRFRSRAPLKSNCAKHFIIAGDLSMSCFLRNSSGIMAEIMAVLRWGLSLPETQPLTDRLQCGANVPPAFGLQLQTLRIRLDELHLVDQGLTVDQVLLFTRRLRLQHRRSHVAAMTAYRVRRHVEPVRDAVQHVAAQELAVDVDELRVRADRAGAGHAVRLRREPLGRAHLKTYSGTGSRAQPRKRAQYSRGQRPRCWP